jgi:hypothetical protein
MRVTDVPPRATRLANLIRTPEEIHQERLADPLRDYFVWWGEITSEDVEGLRAAIENAATEHDMQSYLERNPEMLIQHLGGGHGRWLIPQKRLGAEYVPDFLIADASSRGREWTAVELESPRRTLFNKSGDPSRYLWHAIRQIVDWRVWVELNHDYANRPPEDEGLGLEDMTASTPGLIVIGRRNPRDAERGRFRNALGHQLGITIHTYDWLVERAAGQARALESLRRRRDG